MQGGDDRRPLCMEINPLPVGRRCCVCLLFLPLLLPRFLLFSYSYFFRCLMSCTNISMNKLLYMYWTKAENERERRKGKERRRKRKERREREGAKLEKKEERHRQTIRRSDKKVNSQLNGTSIKKNNRMTLAARGERLRVIMLQLIARLPEMSTSGGINYYRWHLRQSSLKPLYFFSACLCGKTVIYFSCRKEWVVRYIDG